MSILSAIVSVIVACSTLAAVSVLGIEHVLEGETVASIIGAIVSGGLVHTAVTARGVGSSSKPSGGAE